MVKDKLENEFSLIDLLIKSQYDNQYDISYQSNKFYIFKDKGISKQI